MKKYKFLAGLILATVLLFSGTLAHAQAVPANRICSIIVLLGQLNVITPQQIITLNNALGCGGVPQSPDLPPGCISAVGFSPTTGQSCGGKDDPVRFVTPSGDENLVIGTTFDVVNSGNQRPLVARYLNKELDGGARSQRLGHLLGRLISNNTFNWDVGRYATSDPFGGPDTLGVASPGSGYFITLEPAGQRTGGGPIYAHTRNFTITSEVPGNQFQILNPNRNTIWRNDTGEWQTITWDYTPGSMDGSARVRVDLVGTRYGLASGQRVDSKRVDINISPDIQPGRYQIRISDFDNGKIFGYSDYFTITSGGVTGNEPPVVSGVSGPTVLRAGETGTWSVRASDPENQPLNYSVVWGDESVATGSYASTAQVVSQLATFTHRYVSAGTYSPVFTVTDSSGQSARTSLSVRVEGGNEQQPVLSISNTSATSGNCTSMFPQGPIAICGATFTFSLTNYGNTEVYISKAPSTAIRVSTSPASVSGVITGLNTTPTENPGDTTASFAIPAGSSRIFRASATITNSENVSGPSLFRINKINYGTNHSALDQYSLTNGLGELTVSVNWVDRTPPPVSSSISIERPRSGDNWRLGENREIKWEDSGPTGFSYKVYVRGGNPSSINQLIGETTENKLRWSVGSGGQVPVGSYMVEVVKDDGLGYNKNLSGQFTVSSGGHATLYGADQLASISAALLPFLKLFGR